MIYILAIALCLRLVLINQSLWLDESIQALALMGKMGPILSYALADYQPPLYHLIGIVFTKIFGYSEIALRLPSLISGVMTVYFITKIGELIGTKRVGYFAGLLAATNPLLIYYSQEGRTYAMTCFFVTASFYYFFHLLNIEKTKQSPKYTLLYTFYSILFIWTSYLSWFVLLAQGIYVLWRKRFDIFLLQILSALSLLAWLPSFFSSLSIGQSTRTLSPNWGAVVGGLSWKSLPLTWVKFVIGRIGFENKIIYGAIVTLIGVLHFYLLKHLSFKKIGYLLLWILPPIISGTITASFLPVYQYFRVLFVLPAYLLLLALGLNTLKTRLLPILVISIQLLALSYFWITPSFHREAWRSLKEDLIYTDSVALPSRAQSAPLRYYGYDQPIIEPSHEPIFGSKIAYIRYVEDLFDTAKQGEANFIKSGYTITSQKSYSGIQVDIYEKVENRN